MIKLSIITVNLNNAIGLRKTIESVVNQTYIDYEYIIIDGGSTDGSVEEIKEYTAKLSYWVSERDKGIYNAMNKGILKAKGEYCLFLNSGDWLLSEDVLNNVFSKNITEDLVCCKLVNHNINGLIQLPKETLTFYDFYTGSLSHPSTFIKTIFLKEIGMYDETLKIAADWKFFIEAVVIKKCSYISLDIETTVFAPGGLSTIHNKINLSEREAVLNDLFYPFIDDYKLLHIYKSSRFIKIWEKLKDNKKILSIYNFILR